MEEAATSSSMLIQPRNERCATIAGECARAFDAARPATVLGLAAPATDLVELPRAYRNSRRDALDADKARRATKKQRESSP